VARVRSRTESGGHSVPEEKIRLRYSKALKLIPELVEICDVMHIYDNTGLPYRIFKRKKTEYYYWENGDWNKSSIEKLTGLAL